MLSAGAVKPKAVLVPTGFAAETLVRGEADLAVPQISEILPVKGVKLVGPLPRELQKVTVYSAAVGRSAGSPDLARQFISYLGQPPARERFAAHGMDYKD